MKSDHIQRRNKERSKDSRLSAYGETWAVSDLCAIIPESINMNRDVLGLLLGNISASNAAARMIKEAANEGWRLGLASLEDHDFHLDVPEKLIVLDNAGLEAGALVRAQFFYNAVMISLVRALRDAWQEKRHGGFDENYAPESVLLLERVRAADCDIMTILVSWELREQGPNKNGGDLWKHVLGSENGDIATAFANYLERNHTGADNSKALAAAFRQWFSNVHRVNACDHEALDYMDDVINANSGSAFGKKRAGKICVETLSCLPDKTAYLRTQGEDILHDPLFAGLCDPINQAHFMHIMRDAQAVLVQNVPFRDAGLAARIFPDGRMTPDPATVTAQKP